MRGELIAVKPFQPSPVGSCRKIHEIMIRVCPCRLKPATSGMNMHSESERLGGCSSLGPHALGHAWLSLSDCAA